MARDGPVGQGAMALWLSETQEVDEPVYIKESMRLGSFQAQILECQVKPLLGESAHVMVTHLRVGTTQPGGARLKMSSSKVSVIVRNMLESPVFLKKGMQVARVVSASPVELAEPSPEMEVMLGSEDKRQSLSVSE